MVFTFPKDFAQRAIQNRQRQEWWFEAQQALKVVVRGLKIITAFGLILSLLILLIAAVMGVVAVLIASQNDRGGRGRVLVVRQLHSLFYTFRQLLWCYAIFAPDMGEEQDPFLRETAYDLAMICTICCGNPMSLFFMMRARPFYHRRRQRIYRGWSSTGAGGGWGRYNDTTAANSYGVEGVTLVRQGTWNNNHEHSENVILGIDSSSEHRGLLSVAVEFLFGPTPFHPPNAEREKWKLRAAVIVQTSDNPQGGITLRQLAPYADNPPATINGSDAHTDQIVQQGLLQVAYLNGVPKETKESSTPTTDKSQVIFIFPELMAESAVALRYEAPIDDTHDGTFLTMLHAHPNVTVSGRRTTRRTSESLPKYWKEPYYHFTKLTGAQFLYCLGLGLLNALGVFWFGQSLQPTGALGPLVQGTLRTVLVGGLLPVLSFYAKLFFALPLGRLLLVNYLNYVRRRRNARREHLSAELRAAPTSTD